jgi:hypothetical protein
MNNKKIKYPWENSNDPNCQAVIGLLNSLSSNGTKNLVRGRLKIALETLYQKYGRKSIKNYSPEEFDQVFDLIDHLKIKKSRKEIIWQNLRQIGAPIVDKTFREKFWVWDKVGDPNQKVIHDNLELLENLETKRKQRAKLDVCFRFLYEKFGRKWVLDYTAKEFMDLFEFINTKNMLLQSKTRFRTALWNLIKKLVKPMSADGQILKRNYSMIFDSEFFEFHQPNSPVHRKKYYIKAPKIVSFLKEVRKRNPYDYILFKLLLSSVRGIGVVRLKVKDVNFEKCFFDTNDKKRKKLGSRARYFFAKQFVPEFRTFFFQRGYYDENYQLKESELEKMVFGLNHPAQIRKRLIAHDVKWRNHDFRRSVKRIWKNAEMDIVDRRTLSNQKQDIDGVYSENNIWDEPKEAQKTFQKVWDKVFEPFFR